MPSKGRKSASRQAGLKKRRRHGKGGAQVFEAAPALSTRDEEDDDGAESSSPAAQPVAPALPARRATRAAQAAAAAESALEQPYLGAEVRRIGIATAVILGILAIATIALG
jgi:hypothetical protein